MPSPHAQPPAAWPFELQPLVEDALDSALPSLSAQPQTLHRAMRHAVFAGRKRLRPLFLLKVAQACRVLPAAQDLAVRAACAVELVHVASLVHDDLPCFDDRSERYGRPTVHALFGEAQALLVGDALIARGFDAVADVPPTLAIRALRVIKLLAVATGSHSGLSGGQGPEPPSCECPSSPERPERYHELKTAALFALAAEAAALIACAPQPAAWREVGWQVGRAYQLGHTLATLPHDAGVASGVEPGPGAAHSWLVPGRAGAVALTRLRALAAAVHQRIASLAEEPQPLHAFLDEQLRAATAGLALPPASRAAVNQERR